MKTKIIILGIALSFLTIGCSKNDTDTSTPFTTNEAAINSKLDIITDDVSKIVENQLTTEDGMLGRTTSDSPFLPECAEVTRVPDYWEPISIGTVITKTIDFGTDGCPLPNGNTLKGKIIMSFTFDPFATSHTITYIFDDFYHNDTNINGTKTYTVEMGTSSANPENHPIWSMNSDFTAIFSNGETASRVGTRVREITEGYDTFLWFDNVYQVTGNWTTTLPNGAVESSEITSPLVIKMNCPHITQGIITIMRNGNTATLDYGNGDCDDNAIFTFNGIPHDIHL